MNLKPSGTGQLESKFSQCQHRLMIFGNGRECACAKDEKYSQSLNAFCWNYAV